MESTPKVIDYRPPCERVFLLFPETGTGTPKVFGSVEACALFEGEAAAEHLIPTHIIY